MGACFRRGQDLWKISFWSVLGVLKHRIGVIDQVLTLWKSRAGKDDVSQQSAIGWGVAVQHGQSLPPDPLSFEYYARIELVEPLSAETFLHASLSGHKLIARMAADTPLAVGQCVALDLDLGKAHLFDPVTKQRL